MIVYCWDRFTKEYIGVGKADPDPLEPGRWVLPSCSTVEEPLTAGPSLQVVVRSNNSWVLVDDYRGVVAWNKDTSEREEVSEYGSLPGNLTMENPINIACPVWIEGRWQGDKLNAYNLKKAAIYTEEKSQRLKAFTYTLRGTNYSFEANRQAIHGTHNRCLSMVIANSANSSSPVPSPSPIAGKWMTAELEDDGVTRVLVDMTVAEFIAFADYFYDIDAEGRGHALRHTNTIIALYNDPDATSADIMAYDDYLTSWDG